MIYLYITYILFSKGYDVYNQKDSYNNFEQGYEYGFGGDFNNGTITFKDKGMPLVLLEFLGQNLSDSVNISNITNI